MRVNPWLVNGLIRINAKSITKEGFFSSFFADIINWRMFNPDGTCTRYFLTLIAKRIDVCLSNFRCIYGLLTGRLSFFHAVFKSTKTAAVPLKQVITLKLCGGTDDFFGNFSVQLSTKTSKFNYIDTWSKRNVRMHIDIEPSDVYCT